MPHAFALGRENISSWARSENVVENQVHTLSRATAHAVEPSPRPTSAMHSIIVRRLVYWPPNRRGTNRPNRPASSSADTTSGTTRRSLEDASACSPLGAAVAAERLLLVGGRVQREQEGSDHTRRLEPGTDIPARHATHRARP